MIKINIKLKSFEKDFLNNAVFKLQNVNTAFNKIKYTNTSLPKSIKKFTVLCSPHIDKKSREQFEIRTFKTIVDMEVVDYKTACIILEIVKKSSFIGVQLQIGVISVNYM
jgi:small subunit ribosomal protein S10